MSDGPLTNKRVAVALSGGVDSAVTAALLKEQGADVVGLTMRLQKNDATRDAASVAQSLGIPLHVLDMTQAFESCVVRDFLDGYRRGETPLPCAQCNRLIKFGLLMDVAKEHGAVALATGHYAQRIETPYGAQLHQGIDPVKDQSYFLFALSQAQIDYLRFPLGGFSKEETRILAQRYVLPVAQKKDSQDICFVTDGNYVGVLESLDPTVMKPGPIVDQTGRVLGYHKGIVHFTVGQRKGLNLSDRIGDNNDPLFVLALDPLTHSVIVGPREALEQHDVCLREVNWLAPDLARDLAPPDVTDSSGLSVTVRLRSAQKPQKATFFKQKALIRLAEPAHGVAPGQAGVIYQDTRLLGGGWICPGKMPRK